MMFPTRRARTAPYLVLLTSAFAACGAPAAESAPKPLETVHPTDTVTRGALVVTPPTSLETTESGGTAAFAIQLASAPTDTVTVAIGSSNEAEGRVEQAVYTFTPESWSTPQRVVVRGVDDAKQDGPQAFDVTIGPLQSKDPAFEAVTSPNLHFVNLDDDSAGIRVSAAPGLATTEAGGTARFSVALASTPGGEVVVDVRSSNVKEGQLALTTLSFDESNWSSPRVITVTGVDDLVDDGDQPFEVRLAVSRARDARYGKVAPSVVTITNVDDDTAALLVEGDARMSEWYCETPRPAVRVRLAARPEGAVEVPVRSSDTGVFTASPASLTFTPENWSSPQSAFIRCATDAVANPDRHASLVLGPTAAAAGAYRALAAVEHALAILDDDEARVRVGPLSRPYTTEAGGKASFTLNLDAQPLTPVTLTLTSSNPAEGDVTPKTVVWTSAQFREEREIEVTGLSDGVADGNAAFTIEVRVAPTSDPAYRAVTVPPVQLENLDASSNFLRFSYLPHYNPQESRVSADGRTAAVFNAVETTVLALPAGTVLGTLGHTLASTFTLADLSDDGASVAFVGSQRRFADFYLAVAPTNLATHARLPIPANGQPQNAPPRHVSLSGDGRFVAFTSAATNLDATDTSPAADAYLFDRSTTTLTRISSGVAGAPANEDCSELSLSADGSTVVFRSRATNLVGGATTPQERTYLWRRGAGLSLLAVPTGYVPRRALSTTGAWLTIVPRPASRPEGPMRVDLASGAAVSASFAALFGLPATWNESPSSDFDVSSNGAFLSALLPTTSHVTHAGVYDFAARRMMRVPVEDLERSPSGISAPSNDGSTVLLHLFASTNGLVVARHD